MTFFVTPFPGIPQKWKITLKNAHFSGFRAVKQIFSPLTVLLLHKKVTLSLYAHFGHNFFVPEFDFSSIKKCDLHFFVLFIWVIVTHLALHSRCQKWFLKKNFCLNSKFGTLWWDLCDRFCHIMMLKAVKEGSNAPNLRCLSFGPKAAILRSPIEAFWCPDFVEIRYMHGQRAWKRHSLRSAT